MKIIADLHIAPRTVEHLKVLGHDVIRVGDVLPVNTSDARIVDYAAENGRVVLTQDLDFSAIIALSGRSNPSLISLRLASSRIERVNQILDKVLGDLATEIEQGVIVTVTDRGTRRRRLPVSY